MLQALFIFIKDAWVLTGIFLVFYCGELRRILVPGAFFFFADSFSAEIPEYNTCFFIKGFRLYFVSFSLICKTLKLKRLALRKRKQCLPCGYFMKEFSPRLVIRIKPLRSRFFA